MERVANTEDSKQGLKQSKQRTTPEPEVIHSFEAPEDKSKPYPHAVVRIDGIIYFLVRCKEIEAIHAGGVSRIVTDNIQKVNGIAGSGIESSGSVYPIFADESDDVEVYERRFRLHPNQSLL